MDTLKGLIYWETTKGIETLKLAVQDPNDPELSHILTCKGKPERERRISNKRGSWTFKAHKFRDLESVEITRKPIEKVIPDIPENLYIQVSINELRKLGQTWID